MKAVDSLIFIGGFGSNDESMYFAANTLAEYFDDVTPVPFRRAMQNDDFARKIEGHPIVTHSAGMVALGDAEVESVISVAPPIPTGVAKLVARSAVKSYHLLRRDRVQEDKETVSEVMWQTTLELACFPIANAKLLGKIATFNAFEKGAQLADRGIKTRLLWMLNDDYFMPVFSGAFEDTTSRDDSIVSIGIHYGEHDELLVRPRKVVQHIFNQK